MKERIGIWLSVLWRFVHFGFEAVVLQPLVLMTAILVAAFSIVISFGAPLIFGLGGWVLLVGVLCGVVRASGGVVLYEVMLGIWCIGGPFMMVLTFRLEDDLDVLGSPISIKDLCEMTSEAKQMGRLAIGRVA